MTFTSIAFALFFPIVFALYWFVTNKNLSVQNLLLLVASYFFYAYWDWRFLFLLMFSTALDYFTGIKIGQAQQPSTKKLWLWLSVSVNLCFLGYFKYYNFFVQSFVDASSNIGFHTNVSTLNILLPIGISFYTFHGLSYVLDIYYNRIQFEKNFIDYSVFVCFFPLLVSGPIERATHLLPQIKQKRTFDYSQGVDGLRQILWGLFKKIVIADNCAEYANLIFNHSNNYSGSTLVVGALFFSFQIYGDFSGYSDIALGTARLLGIELFRNFAFPYFSRDIAEFWRRWNISLSSWFRDYVYIPLGGSKGSKLKSVRNIFILFILSGFWHGANWTFILWGILNAAYFLPLLLFKKNRTHLETVANGRLLPSITDCSKMLLTFSFTTIAWIFFRAKNIEHAIQYLSTIFSKTLFTLPHFKGAGNALFKFVLVFIFMSIEWVGKEQQYAIATIGSNWPRMLRWTFYMLLLFSIAMFMETTVTPFIYFQF